MKKVFLPLLCIFAFNFFGFSQTVTINTGNNIQQKVDDNPEGTTFNISAGVYRMQSIFPKNNQKFIGVGQVILDGSELINNWVRDGDYWYHVGIEQTGDIKNLSWCEDTPRCNWPEDLFKNDVPLKHVSTKNGISNDSEWFFEKKGGNNNDKIWVKFNPASFSMELSVTPIAFNATGNNVTIDNLIIQKYASPTQEGAIGGGGTGLNGCTIKNCTIQLNHGVGINFTGTSTITNNIITRMGMLGIKTRDGSVDSVVEDNEISYNMYAGYNYAIEGGGSKFARSVGLQLINNHAHHNIGPGLWTDIDNYSTVYEGNLCEYNDAQGIFHEISYNADIRCNTMQYNNQNPKLNIAGNIFISNSSDAHVHENVVRVGANENLKNGITIKCTDRFDSNNDPYLTNDNIIEDNDIYFEVATGKTGITFDTDCPELKGNIIRNNRYHVQNTGGNYFVFEDRDAQTLTWMVAQGYEEDSTIDNNLSAAPKYACDGSDSNDGVPIGAVIWLKGNTNSYVCSENGLTAMSCNRTNLAGWTKWYVEDAGNDKIALKSSNQGLYAKYNYNTSEMWALDDTLTNNAKFTWIENSDGTISLKGYNGKYVSSENGTNPMTCDSDNAYAWEKFNFGITSQQPLGISRNNILENQFQIYPIPNNGTFNIEIADELRIKSNVKVGIYNAQGRSAYQQILTKKTLGIQGLASGLYFVRLTSDEFSVTKKIIVN